MASVKNGSEKNDAAKNVNEKNETVAAENAGAKNKKEANVNIENGTVMKEPSYTAEEFCSNAQELFCARPECVRAAFMECKVTSCTKAEAHRIVDDFLHKEVK